MKRAWLALTSAFLVGPLVGGSLAGVPARPVPSDVLTVRIAAEGSQLFVQGSAAADSVVWLALRLAAPTDVLLPLGGAVTDERGAWRTRVRLPDALGRPLEGARLWAVWSAGNGFESAVRTVPGASPEAAPVRRGRVRQGPRPVPPCPCSSLGGPSCDAAPYRGYLFGDRSGPVITETGCGSAWFRVELREDSHSPFPEDLRMDVILDSPAGDNYDLFVHEPVCGALRGVSLAPAGQTDYVHISVFDNPFGDDTTNVHVEIRQRARSSCANWELVLRGD